MKRMILSCVTLVLMAMPAWAQVTVSGEGKVTATPDMATVVLAVSTEDVEALTALNNNNVTMGKLVDALKGAGLTKKELKTNLFQVNPKYVYDNNKPPRLVGYVVTNSLVATVCKTEDLGKILDAAVKNGANNVESLHWGFQNPEKMLDEARVAAVLDAKRKATLLANTSGYGLSNVVSISEQQSYSPRATTYARMASAERADVPVEAGTLTLHVNVSVVWNVGPPLTPAK